MPFIAMERDIETYCEKSTPMMMETMTKFGWGAISYREKGVILIAFF